MSSKLDTIPNVIKYATSAADLKSSVYAFVKRRCGRMGTEKKVKSVLSKVFRGLAKSKSSLVDGIVSRDGNKVTFTTGFVNGIANVLKCSKDLLGVKVVGYVLDSVKGMGYNVNGGEAGQRRNTTQPPPQQPQGATVIQGFEKERGNVLPEQKKDKMEQMFVCVTLMKKL